LIEEIGEGMAKIDQLIVKAKGAFEAKREKLTFGSIEHVNGTWNCCFYLWDGVPYSGGRAIESFHGTYEEAVKEANKIFEEYPSKSEVTIIVVDCDAV
jgi:hypothetical protein